MARTHARKTDVTDVPKKPRGRFRLLTTEQAEADAASMTESERLESIREYAQHLPKNMLECREMGHQWRVGTARVVSGGAFVRVLRCRRCPVERHTEISSRGEILSSNYVYPEGYLRKGMGAITGEGRNLLRLTSIIRSNPAVLKED